jgi:hypothetical protein
MSYYDSAEDMRISAERARQELARHGVADDWADFVADQGEAEDYDAQTVLAWLGY